MKKNNNSVIGSYFPTLNANKHQFLHKNWTEFVLYICWIYKTYGVMKNLSQSAFHKALKFLLSQQRSKSSRFLRESGEFPSPVPCCCNNCGSSDLYCMAMFKFAVCCSAKTSQIVLSCQWVNKHYCLPFIMVSLWLTSSLPGVNTIYCLIASYEHYSFTVA